MSLDSTLTAIADPRLQDASRAGFNGAILKPDKAASIASMDRIRRMIATYKAKLFINHDKAQSDELKLLPAFYD